jgi:nickel transport system permease protein
MHTILKRLLADRMARGCMVFIAMLLALGVLAPVLPIADPTAIDITGKFQMPGGGHWLGTDQLGRDIFSRLVWGIRTTLCASLAAMLITSAIGALYGAIAGGMRGRVDAVMMRLADVMMSFPSEVLILAIVGMMGPGLTNMIIACVVAKWAWYARMMRTIVRRISDAGYVRFARVCGAGEAWILLRHLAPGAAGEFFVLVTLDTGSVVLMISALSFLGLGVQPPVAEWGMMLSEAKEVMLQYPWQMFWPGVAILSTVACFNFLGDCVRDAFDLRHAGRDGQ